MNQSSPTATGRADSGESVHRTGAFAVCIGLGALTILDLSGVNVALPSIESSLHAGSTQLQLIVAGYALAFGLALVPTGRLGDRDSRRRMFLIGVAGFVVASALCAVAPNDTWLTCTRFLQGVAAGTQMPQVIGFIQQLYRGEERGKAFGAFGSMIGVATSLGPTLSGALIALGGPTNGWRLLFVLNVPLGLTALVLGWRLLPKAQDRDDSQRQLDPVGIVLLGLAVIGFMLPFLLTTGRHDSPDRWFALIGAGVFGAGFVLWERRYAVSGRSPVIRLELFRTRSYRNGAALTAVYFAALPASFLITTLYLQEGLKTIPLFAGMVSIPFAVTSGTAAWIGGRLVQRYGRSLVVLGLCIMLVGTGLLLAAATLTPPSWTEPAMAAALFVAGAGGGLVVSPNQTLTLAEVPVTQAGVAGSVNQLGQRIGTATGVAAVTAVFFSTIAAAGAHAGLASYHAAFRGGYLVTMGLVLVALVIGIVDLVQRRRDDREPSGSEIE